MRYPAWPWPYRHLLVIFLLPGFPVHFISLFRRQQFGKEFSGEFELLVDLQKEKRTAYLQRLPGTMNGSCRDKDDRSPGNNMFVHLLPEMELNLGPQVKGVSRIGSDMEKYNSTIPRGSYNEKIAYLLT